MPAASEPRRPDPPGDSTVTETRRIALRQIGVVLLGLVAAAIMIRLGIWQLDVYSSQGSQVATERAAEPPVSLLSVARPGQPVGDAYGRTVQVAGRYDSRLQLLLPTDGDPSHQRVLTALLLPGGGAVPVVRGLVGSGADIPAAPTGAVSLTGIFLPSEQDQQRNPTLGGGMTSVQLPALAQRWSPTLSNGFVTADAGEARAEGLAPAPATLPEGQGRLQNAAYALQWWVFTGFAMVMAGRVARDIGRRADYEYVRELDGLEPEPEQPIEAEPSLRSGG